MSTYLIITFMEFSLFSVAGLGTLNNDSNLLTSISQDDNGQISAGIVGAIIGSIIGAFATYLFALMIENRREKNQKEERERNKGAYRTLIRYELNVYYIYLQTYFRPLEDRITKDELLTNFRTLPRHFINMTPETKQGYLIRTL